MVIDKLTDPQSAKRTGSVTTTTLTIFNSDIIHEIISQIQQRHTSCCHVRIHFGSLTTESQIMIRISRSSFRRKGIRIAISRLISSVERDAMLTRSV